MGNECLYPRQAIWFCLQNRDATGKHGNKRGIIALKDSEGGVPNQMRTRIFRTLSTTLSLLLLVAVPTQASPIKFVDVINVMGDLQNGGQFQQLKLRAALQDPTTRTQTASTSSTT